MNRLSFKRKVKWKRTYEVIRNPILLSAYIFCQFVLFLQYSNKDTGNAKNNNNDTSITTNNNNNNNDGDNDNDKSVMTILIDKEIYQITENLATKVVGAASKIRKELGLL